MYAVPNGIAKTAAGDAVYGDPTVSAKDFKAYLRWVQTVWRAARSGHGHTAFQ
jgi:hypothetical protein